MADGASRPDWTIPALRCGLEVTLILLITTFLAVHLDHGLLLGLVLVVGPLSAVVLLFWCVKEHTLDWIRYASRQGRRRSGRGQ